MDAVSIVAVWKQRLTALADSPAYVFRNTPQQLVVQEYRRLTTFVGYPEAEVTAMEARLGLQFPVVFRQYLLEVAKSPGDLFRGSNLAGLSEFEQFRADALALMAETDPNLTLPSDAVVFLFHQGYTFMYLQGTGDFDAPVMQWAETDHEAHQVAPTFAGAVDAELQLMESNNCAFRETGGYYKTLNPDGGSSMEFPALNSGVRPLDRPPP